MPLIYLYLCKGSKIINFVVLLYNNYVSSMNFCKKFNAHQKHCPYFNSANVDNFKWNKQTNYKKKEKYYLPEKLYHAIIYTHIINNLRCTYADLKLTVPEVNVLTFIGAKCNIGELYAAKDIMGNSTGIRRCKVRVIDVEGHVFLEFCHSTLHITKNMRRVDCHHRDRVEPAIRKGILTNITASKVSYVIIYDKW